MTLGSPCMVHSGVGGLRRRPESLFRTLLSHLRGERNPFTGRKGIFDDGLQGARAASTLGAAAEAAIHLLRAARKVQSSVHGIANIMVAEDVAGTDDHEVGGP